MNPYNMVYVNISKLMIIILLHDEIHPKLMNWGVWKRTKCSWNSFEGSLNLKEDFPTAKVQYISSKWINRVWFSNRRGMNPYNMVYVNIPKLMIIILLCDEIHPKLMNWGVWKLTKCSWNSFDGFDLFNDVFVTAKVQYISCKWITRVWFSNCRGTKYLS